MKQTLSVGLGTRAYDIVIAPGLISDIGNEISPPESGRAQFVVTDATVADLHLARLHAALDRDIAPFILPAGEASKSWKNLERLVEGLLGAGVERGDNIIALGGGVVGDLAGFAAAITRRGCAFVQVPTTLLAQVDSSVGGKTAINAAAGKNLVGAFHQPSKVLIDPELLDTLAPRQMRAGYAEVLKYGLLGDADFAGWCGENGGALLAGDRGAQVHAIAHSCRMKADIVACDEREAHGTRARLNLGHTFGHAFEAEAGFSDALLHGEAVAIGMACAFEFSVRRGLCSAADAARARDLIVAAGLPDTPAPFGFDAARLAAHMQQDKKAAAGRTPFVLARSIGDAFLDSDVALDDVTAYLREIV